MNTQHIKYYECGICDHLHPWHWNGDCREDSNRFAFEDMPDNAIIMEWQDRVSADLRLQPNPI